MGVAFPLKVNNTVDSLTQSEETLAYKLTPGIEELRADLLIADTTLDALGTKVSELLGQAFAIAAEKLRPTMTPRLNRPCT